MSTDTLEIDALERLVSPEGHYSYGFLDESSKREVRRAILSAVAIPGYQVPFGSREMPVARGWGSGGLQLSLALVGPEDTVKVIDQGDDAGVNASNLRRLIERSAEVETTTDLRAATLIQSRHRIPEEGVCADQILVLQVPVPEPLRGVERREPELRRMHAEADYSRVWVSLYEDYVRHGIITHSTGYPVLVNDRYVMATSPIPRWDVPKLHDSDGLILFGAGREKIIYAVPPHTKVEPLTFEDVPFQVEHFDGAACQRCGSTESYLTELAGEDTTTYLCSDTDWCARRLTGEAGPVRGFSPGKYLHSHGGGALHEHAYDHDHDADHDPNDGHTHG
ncbi:MAG: alpha-D-ribose 1-methylphosphonate 5-phosphate C-P-lyase PhnJ [Chloroflexi bacterium]|nr:alpha-D-ribose 1-methylphosphonate 5-phosphate C-P-lyase PhnJ [Chloroflexota bacterium]